jgi:hypothetical protein
VICNNIEMGGTCDSLTDQDNQDGQDGQDGQSDDIDDAGGRAGGGIAIQGAGTSLRRTRLGKVVKYRDE